VYSPEEVAYSNEPEAVEPPADDIDDVAVPEIEDFSLDVEMPVPELLEGEAPRPRRRKLGGVWAGGDIGKGLDAVFAGQREAARTHFNDASVMLGTEMDALVLVIPVPSLAFEYLIAQSGFPLGLIMQIVALEGVGKSALTAEIGRWFDAAGGGMVLMENETKFNPFWYSSILRDAYRRLLLHRCKAVEDWQEHTTYAVAKMKTDLLGTKKQPGPGRSVPVLFCVDSMMGKMCRETQEKIFGAEGKDGKIGKKGAGFAQSRAHPVEAGSITKYLRSFPQQLDGWPFAYVLTNHLRIVTDEQGYQERNKAGGKQINFQEAIELELKKVGGHKKMLASAAWEGIPLQISCEKNSFGPTHRKIQTRLLWWDEPGPTGRPVAHTVWDWDWSTVWTLDSLMRGANSNPRIKAKLAAIDFHLECPARSDVENLAWSKSLGMTANDASSWTQVGAWIRENTELTAKLRDCLGVVERPVLSDDYLRQIQRLKKKGQ
jgi:hypothetical protein